MAHPPRAARRARTANLGPVSAQYIFTTYKLSRRHPPDRQVLSDISLSFLPGAKIGVLGYNGAGKSTLLRIMAGLDDGYDGEAQLAPGASVGLLEQEPQLDSSTDVRGNVEQGVTETAALLQRFEELSMNYSDETADELGSVQERIDAVDGWNLETTLEIAMDALRCPPGDAEISLLSGGERRRVALCRLLLSQPDLLLLDEPTNHLDAESVAWLERHLGDYPGTVVAVTHDRYFLDNVAGWILELDRGRGIPYQGNYSGWLEQKRMRMQTEARQDTARRQTIERELEWVRSSASARRTKPKARLNAYEALLAQDRNAKLDQVQIHIPAGPRLGEVVVQAEGLRKSFGDLLLIDDLSFSLPRGGIVGVIGPNGAGKTTLIRMITGAEQPDAGTLRIGDTVQVAWVDQTRELDPAKTVWEEISGGQDQIALGERTINSRAYVAGFNFKGSDQQQRVAKLSGGERNRLHLAKLLRSGGNLLLLDEPTNDLDVDTLRALEEALLAFAGCAVVVSHDRWFLDRIATHVLAFEGDSQARWFEGNFEAYETFRRETGGAETERPKRLTYKKLVRG
ncbi:MAG: energy-dependent translational throttle protein EttA [Solirubrobacterales bacterium]|nr:MAG: energy-dependent translational throttle protein EttA [Solirubrobacterales bacterium]